MILMKFLLKYLRIQMTENSEKFSHQTDSQTFKSFSTQISTNFNCKRQVDSMQGPQQYATAAVAQAAARDAHNLLECSDSYE